LGDVAAVTLHRLHHQLECGIDDGAGLLWIEVFDQLHRTFDVGEKNGDCLALALESLSGGCLGDEDRRIA
jgi:hypothetical protein